jgi:hypothetical protein
VVGKLVAPVEVAVAAVAVFLVWRRWRQWWVNWVAGDKFQGGGAKLTALIPDVTDLDYTSGTPMSLCQNCIAGGSVLRRKKKRETGRIGLW